MPETGSGQKETPKIGAGRPGPGRPKGVPNKMTASIRAAIGEAFTKLGGVKSLVKWGKENPDEFYKLWGRLAPSEVELTTPDGPLEVAVTHRIVDACK